jgi:hypothetical protein
MKTRGGDEPEALKERYVGSKDIHGMGNTVTRWYMCDKMGVKLIDGETAPLGVIVER